MAKTIVVCGATGGLGGSVTRHMLKEGWKVRGITRDASKPSAQKLKDQGIDMVSADLDNPVSLIQAFSGATAIFGVTDFWQFVADPSNHELAAKTGTTVKWNFYKYLVARDGSIVGGFNRMTTPEKLEPQIEKLLAAK